MFGVAAATCGAAAVLLAPVALTGGVFAIAAVVFALAAATLAFHCRHWWGRACQAAVGARSERRVARVLARQGYGAVLHSVLVGGGGDVDHLVVGPKLVAVETKTGSGRMFVTKGSLTVGRRVLPGDPVAQVRRQAAAAGRIANNYVSAVVCVPDGSGPPLTVGDVTVCNLEQLPAVIGSTRDVFADRGRARSVAADLVDAHERFEAARVRAESPSS